MSSLPTKAEKPLGIRRPLAFFHLRTRSIGSPKISWVALSMASPLCVSSTYTYVVSAMSALPNGASHSSWRGSPRRG